MFTASRPASASRWISLAFLALFGWSVMAFAFAPQRSRLTNVLPDLTSDTGAGGMRVLLLNNQFENGSDAAARLLSVVGTHDSVALRTIVMSAGDSPLESKLQAIAWRQLLQAYGYSEGPLLITFDGEGHALWIISSSSLTHATASVRRASEW